MNSRREMLKLMAATGGALVVTGGLAARTLRPDSRPVAAAAPALAGPIPPFQVAMPIPRTLRPTSRSSTTDYYTLDVQQAVTEILPGKRTTVLTYGGSLPGPVIRARSGRTVVVRQTNRIADGTSMHLHGAVVDPANDGGPMDLIAPGATRTYTFPNRQVAASLWYHDHAHMADAEHVYRGMSGFYLVGDANEDSLGLPQGAYDVPVMIRDVGLDDDGSLYFDHLFTSRPQILVNGKPQPYFRVRARKYRLRLVNGSNLRPFEFKLDDGASFQQISTDRGLLPAPVTLSSLPLSPGERADIVVDFSRYAAGTRIVLQNTFFATDTTAQIMRFDVGDPAPDTSRVPAELATLPALGTPTLTRSFALTLDPATGGGLINGRQFDENRVDFTVRQGATEIWEISNVDQIPHNFHIHLVDFRVLDVDGTPPAPGEAGLKDIVSVMPGQKARIQVRFAYPYLGRYYYHCHLIDHGAMGMMGQFDIVRS
ncbi:multicopper oxidase family protein [Streptomyces sp. LUP30]|uniref:multicopper oxidase family protein n=1 Tax=Streptomyces sp. LUP30 TaxID=1890285 RepID=UPI000851B01D|nr:multicopper oxidase domain-containing protein [Streptomyces sp. LUP30]